jgi:hypothetical protein
LASSSVLAQTTKTARQAVAYADALIEALDATAAKPGTKRIAAKKKARR